MFSSTDAAVAGALQELKRQHCRVPADVALAGFSNASFTTLTEPPLTTVDRCSRQLGHEAVTQLLRLLRAEPADAPVVLRPQLLVRASSQRLATVSQQLITDNQ